MIPNPIAIRAITETRHLINAILKKYKDIHHDNSWTFDTLNIELAREINTKKDKKEIISGQSRDKRNKQDAVDFIVENCGKDFISTANILKVRLWQQQGYRCLYSLTSIETPDIVREIKTKGESYQIDHALPKSRSNDDSLSNKVLVLSNENQTKGDKTPFEHFGDNKQKWDKFEAYITTKENYLKLGKAKVGKLLDKNFANREKEFLNRHLNDTRIISKTVKNYIEKHLSFQENDTIQRRVYVVSGKLTSTLRHQWGLENKNRNNHYHHFEDAVLIAFSNNATIQKLSTYYKSLETYKKEGKNKPKFTKPYDKFTHDIKSMIEKMTVVREPKVSNKGEIHKETIKKGDKGKGLLVRGGIASNGEIVRTDVFKDLKKEIYYLVPLYLKDLNKTLPEKFITANKKEEEWQVLDLTKQKFVFSLYPSDLVEVKTKKVSAFGYFISPDSSTANLTLLSPDNISNDSFKKSIAYFTLTIETVQTMPKDEWKKHFEELSKLKSIKKETKLFTKTLTLKLKILNIEKTINDILHELNHHYTIVRLENHLNNIEIDKNPSSENKLQIAIVLEKRALRGIGVKQSIISFKKFSIDLLGDITEAPMEKTRKPFTKS